MLSVATHFHALPEQPVSRRVMLAIEPDAQTAIQKMSINQSIKQLHVLS